MTTTWSARLSCRSPKRFRRYRTTWPEEAGIGADAELVKHVGAPRAVDRQDASFVLAGLGFQGLDPFGKRPKGGDHRGPLDVGPREQPQPAARRDQPPRAQCPQ